MVQLLQEHDIRALAPDGRGEVVQTTRRGEELTRPAHAAMHVVFHDTYVFGWAGILDARTGAGGVADLVNSDLAHQ